MCSKWLSLCRVQERHLTAVLCAALGQSRKDANTATLESQDCLPKPSSQQWGAESISKTPWGWRQREQAALTKELPPGQEGELGRIRPPGAEVTHCFLQRAHRCDFIDVKWSKELFGVGEAQSAVCLGQEWLHALPPFSRQECVTAQKMPETKIINALSPTASSLSDRNIAQ